MPLACVRPSGEDGVHMTRRSVDDLRDDLQRWVAAGLLTRGEAEGIAAHETAAAHAEGGISVLAEALGYAGSALAVAGIAAGLGQSWDSLRAGGRVAAVAVPTGLAVIAGWLLHSKTEPAFRRLMSLLWFLAIGGIAASAAVLIGEYADIDREWTVLVIGGAMAIPAFLLWLARRAVLQQMALLASLLVTMLGVFVIVPGEPNGTAVALACWALGLVWVVLGWRRWLKPPLATMVVGSLLASLAPSFGAPDHEWMLTVGIVTGVALMALSVKAGAVAVLTVGTVAVFGYVTAVVLHYFGDQLGVPLALMVIGAVFIALALLASRLGRFRHRRA